MKSNIKTMSVAAVAALAMVSCSNHDSWTSYEDLKKAEYDAAFVKKYGTIDPNHTWGFGSVVTRGANAGDGYVGNSTWEQFNADELVNITDEERAAVLEAIAAKVTGSRISEEIVFPWENYYLQDVISGQNGNWTGAGSNGTSSSSYDFEAFDKGNECPQKSWPGYDYENYTQVTNSGHINSYFQKQNADGTQTRIEETALMTGMQVGTYEEMKERQFRWYINCHENLHWSEYITVQVNGSWYICFDFACGHAENDVDGNPGRGAEHNDWDYNDWIIKITEAVPHNGKKTPVWDGKEEGIQYAVRIFCEDLGAIGDFDFNDVVFDALIKDGKTYIKLLAAGGTMNLTVAGHEVHKEFGEDVTTMINTGAGPDKETPVEFVVDDDFGRDYANIPVVVTTAADMYNTSYELKNTIGHAPQKLCVPVNTGWTIEYKGIELAYPAFKNWVVNANNDNVFENADEEYIYAR